VSAGESPAEGQRFGQLTLERIIGRGAFADVWLATDEKLRRPVALKFLRHSDPLRTRPQDRDRFLEEARIIAGFQHRNMVTLFHLHEVPGSGFALELEYLDGGSVQDLLNERGQLPVDEAMEIAKAVASALAGAHAAGILHGDVKPGNILRGLDGRIKLGDFGLASLLGVKDLERSRFAGTPLYLAPEVVAEGPFGPTADIWSFGVTLYQILAGRAPFARSSLFSLLLAIEHEAPSPLDAHVPPDVAAIVERCLAKRPEDRYRDGAELRFALEERERPGGSAGRPMRSTLVRKPAVAPRMAGRDSESAYILEALDHVSSGPGRVIVITGGAGMGKSTLVRSALEIARERGCRTLLSEASSIEGILRPVFVAARRAAAAPGDASDDLDAVRQFPTVVGTEKAIESLTREHSLVIAVEDVQRAGAENVDQLIKTCRRLHALPVLWLVTERTSDLGLAGSEDLRADPLLAEEFADRLDLGPIGDDTLYEIVGRELERGRPAGDLLDHIVRRSEGNPLLAVQLTRHLREVGALEESHGEWLLTRSMAVQRAPPALRELVSRRLRNLPEEFRELLDVAAVDGLEFDGEALAAASELPVIKVLRQLQTLYRTHGLVSPREHGFRFAHPLLQEVIYGEVAPSLRRVLHRMLAEHLEQRREPVDPERLGVHWERSDAPARAQPWLLRAAGAAANRLENFRCVDLVTRAGVVPGEIRAPVAGELQETLFQFANSLGELGRHDERRRVYEDLLRAAAETDDDELRLRVYARRGLTRVLRSGPDEETEAELREATDGLPDGLARGIGYYALGIAERTHGRFDLAKKCFLAADALFLANGAHARHGSVLDQLGTIAVRCGHIQEAARLYADAAQACREAGRLANAAISEVNGISARIDMGEIDGQVEGLANAARLLDVDGLLGAAARVRVVQSEVHYALGEFEQAHRLVHSVHDVLARLDMTVGIYEAHCLTMYYALAAGELDEAETACAVTREAAERLADPRANLVLDAQRAVLAVRRGRTGSESAESIATEVIAGLTELREPSTTALAGILLAEAALLGLPIAALTDLPDLLPDPEQGAEGGATVRSARALVQGLLAVDDRASDPAELERFAQALARRDVGRLRALLWVASNVLRSEAARRRGDARGAAEARKRAHEAANRMGYAWAGPWSAP